MSEELVKIGQQSLAETMESFNDAFAVNFKEVRLSPFTLAIDQPGSTRDEGAPALKVGHIRTLETNEIRKSVKVIILAMPTQSRKLQTGKYPNQKLVCFSRDMQKPDRKSPESQAMTCSGCRHSSWEKYNDTQNPDDAPGCKITDRVWMLDFDNLVPAQIYVQGKGRTEGLQAGLDKLLKVMQAYAAKNGGRASWTQFVVTITTEKYSNNANYAVRFVDPRPMTQEEFLKVRDAVIQLSEKKAQAMAAADAKATADENKVDQENADKEFSRRATGETKTETPKDYSGSEEV
jgi:hypothetical protein